MEVLQIFSFKETMTCFMVLFAVIDIIGSIPIIVSLKQKFGQIEAKRASITAGLIMIFFLFVGNKILKFIGVDVNSFAIAGAFVIFIIALEMILGIEINKTTEGKSSIHCSYCVSAGCRSRNFNDYFIFTCKNFMTSILFLGSFSIQFRIFGVEISSLVRKENGRGNIINSSKSFRNYLVSDFN